MSLNETEASPGNGALPPSPAPAQPRVVIIGFGSPIRGDDALGPLVAERLREQLETPRVEVVSRHILTAELAERLQRATLVIFLDASVDGVVGEVAVRRIEPDTRDAGPLAHALDIGGLLGWTAVLYGQAPAALLVSTRAATFDYADYRLSPAVAATVPPMIQRVHQLVSEHLAEKGSGTFFLESPGE